MNAIKQPSIVDEVPIDTDRLLGEWQGGTMLKDDYRKLYRAVRNEVRRRANQKEWTPLEKVENYALSQYMAGYDERCKGRNAFHQRFAQRLHKELLPFFSAQIGYVSQKADDHWITDYIQLKGKEWSHLFSQTTCEPMQNRLQMTRNYLEMMGAQGCRTAIFIDYAPPSESWVSGLYVGETLHTEGGKLLDVNNHQTGIALMNLLLQLTPHHQFYIQTVRVRREPTA